MRILQVVPTLQVGGAERVAGLLAREQRRAGHAAELAVLYAPEGGPWEEALRRDAVPLHFLGKGPGFDPRAAWRLGRLVRRLRPEVVHTHLYAFKYALAARPAARFRLVHTLHNLAEREAPPADRRVQGLGFRLGAVPVAIGEAVADSAERVYGRRPAWVIPNGIDAARFRPEPGWRAATRGALGTPPDAPVALFVGRLDEQKNPVGLVRAWTRAGGAGELWLAGDGPLRGAVEAAAREAPGVRVLGLRGDVPRLMAAADVFVLASRYEGHPLVLLEALAAGLPAVATAVGSVPEILAGEDPPGVLVPEGDEAALAAALRRVLGDAAGRRRLAEAARRAGDRHDAAVMAATYLRLYAAVLGRSGEVA